MLVEDSDEDTPSKAPSQKKTAIPKPVRKPRQPVKVEASAKIPVLHVKSHQSPKLKTELSDSFTPASAADVKGLPVFIHRTWSSRFLPAAY